MHQGPQGLPEQVLQKRRARIGLVAVLAEALGESGAEVAAAAGKS